MAKKVSTRTKKVEEKKVCGDCSHGEYLTYKANLDYLGNPICLKCPFAEFNRMRSEKACNNFKTK